MLLILCDWSPGNEMIRIRDKGWPISQIASRLSMSLTESHKFLLHVVNGEIGVYGVADIKDSQKGL